MSVASSCVLWVACADGPSERFARDAIPVLEARCASSTCHGVAADDPWPTVGGLFFQLDRAGRIADPEAARTEALARATVRAPRTSTLLRVPLPPIAGGGPHAGGAVFTGPDDEALLALVHWLEAEEVGGEDLELTPLEVQFRDDVAPVLLERCARDGCHSSRDIAFGAFTLHPVAPDMEISDLDVRAGRRSVRKFIDLWSADPTRSRLVRKAISVDSGGLLHRGGAGTLFPESDDPLGAPGMQAILQWIDAERAALGVRDGYAPSGVIYVAGPPSSRTPFRIEPEALGSDLYLVGYPNPGSPENLTASLHPDHDIEVRDPTIAHDGSRVAFAIRHEGETRFAIVELELASRTFTTITRSDASGSFVQPVYAPDGRILAAWDGHGQLASDGSGVAPDLVLIDQDGNLEQLTYTPAPEVYPTMLAAGKTRGQVMFSTRRDGVRGVESVLFRFPLCHDPTKHGDPEYHVHFGATIAPNAPLVARDMPDGRQLLVVLPTPDAADDRGMLAILDRSFGPELGDRIEETSLGGYRSPYTVLDAAPRFRDPSALPDGRVLIVVDDAIAIASVEDGLTIEPFVSPAAGASLRSPVAIFSRPPEDDGHEPITDPTLDEAFLALRDLSVLETLYGRPEPLGARVPREDIAFLRLIGADDTRAVERYADGGTTVGLSARIPSRILAELELPSDLSAWLRVPARTPMRLAFLNRDGMEVGRSIDRWYYGEGGEKLPGGTNLVTFAHDCSGCHGSVSGDPAEAQTIVPDALSSASVTLSTHELRNRRLPLPPIPILPNPTATDFVTLVAPYIQTNCVECHGGATPAGALALDGGMGSRFPASYEGLFPFVDARTLRARRSPLVERLTGRELEAEAPMIGRCPPEGADPALVRAVARWIEAGAFYDVTLREGSP